MKKFSVVTSCLNSEKYITETIESVISQTLLLKSKCLIEYIIIDGGSTDSTNAIINNFKLKFPQIIHIIEKDNGLYDGLVKGFKLVTGDFVCYLNAGDFLNKSAFSVLDKVFVNKHINWVTGMKVIYNEDSEVIDIQIPYKYRSNLISCGVYGKIFPFIQQESTFWRKSLLDNFDFDFLKKLKLSGDMYMWSQFSKNNQLYVVNSYLSGFKYHKDQLSFKYNESYDAYLEETKKFVKKKKLIDIIHIIIDSPFWYISRNNVKILSIFSNKYYFLPGFSKLWITKKKTYKSEIFCWVCDFRQNNGEGILSKIFLKNFALENNLDEDHIILINIKNKIILSKCSENNNFYNQKKDLSLIDKYLAPFYGIIFLWLKYFQGKKIMYINFLPLWNFLIFLLVPPNTILGPITGSKYYNKYQIFGFEKFFRKFLMIPFFKISNIILCYRFNKLIFSSINLRDLLSRKIIAKSKFNYIFENVVNSNENRNLRNLKKREFDFIFYIRSHPSKGNKILLQYIEKLKKYYKIITVGEKLNLIGIKEFGLISRQQVIDLCSRCKFAFLSDENFYSLFSFECIQSNTIVFFNKLNEYDKKLELESKIFPINYDEINKNIDFIRSKYETIVFS